MTRATNFEGIAKLSSYPCKKREKFILSDTISKIHHLINVTLMRVCAKSLDLTLSTILSSFCKGPTVHFILAHPGIGHCISRSKSWEARLDLSRYIFTIRLKIIKATIT